MADSKLAPARPTVGGPFRLSDHHGNEVSDETYLGRHVLMLFGFTHCRVVCPRSLRKLSLVLDALGDMADRIVALYITVDPERDDPAAMRSFLLDYPRFTGLTGPRGQIDSVREAYRVFAKREENDEEGDYAIAHTSLAYLIDDTGAYSAHFPLVLDEAELVERLRAGLS